MDKYNESDRYCYDKTSVLKNKLNIENENSLEEAERDITAKTSENIEYKAPPYNLETLKKIHKTLFIDIYEWAGEIRDVSISKGDTLFCMPQHILSNINSIFSNLEKDNSLQGLSQDEFYNKISYYYCEFNMIHPFREGNGRVQRIFFEYLALDNGYLFDWSKVKQDTWLEVNIQGVADYSGMKKIFKDILNKVDINE